MLIAHASRDDAPARLEELAERVGRSVPVHLYIDTGMNRVGLPYRRALLWIEALAASRGVRIGECQDSCRIKIKV